MGFNAAEFKNPSSSYRPAPFWSWNDKLDKEELKRQIREMADKGWGGYFMHSRVGLVTGYMSDDWMEMVRACAEEAGKTGTLAWLYDEDKWPSGFAGGEVPQLNESYRSRYLLLLRPEEKTDNDTVLTELSREEENYLICRRVAELNDPWFNGTCYVDLMNPEAVQAFIDCTHERYKKACGEYFGKEIPGIFTDEPNYLRDNRISHPVLPWSDCLPEYFFKKKEYKIEEHLESLFFDTGDYRKVRFDFFDCVTRLFLESFTKKYYEWCEKNNLIMTGHFLAEDNLMLQTRKIGAAMPHYQFMHWPGIDKLSRHLEQLVTVKQLTSVVDQLEKERAFCEVFGCVGQHVSFYHRKWIADWQAVLGISYVNHHLSLYSMRGERKRDYPANLYYQQPWWDEEKAFADYIGRISYVAAAGKRKVDILVIHPIASMWSEYSPLHRENNFMIENNMYDKPFEQLSKELIANKLDFHYGDEIIMEEHARVEGGKLVIGTHSYSTVVVPPCCTLRKNTVRLLEEFAKAAGKDRLIFVKPYPDRIDGIKENDMPLLGQGTKTSSVSQAISLLDKYYSGRVRITDRNTNRNASSIICSIRETGEGELIFIANTDEKKDTHAIIQIPGASESASFRLLDLMSGEFYAAPVRRENGTAILDVTFYPAGSMLLYKVGSSAGRETENSPALKEAPLYLDSGISFCNNTAISCSNTNSNVNIIDNWDVSVLEDNVLPLNDVTLFINGQKVLDNQPVAKAWHDYFYKAPDGTPFKAVYTFQVIDVPEGSMYAAIEVAENLDRITLNGTELKALKARNEMGAFDPNKSWKDINFTKVPLNGAIQKGQNILVIEGRKVNNITGPGCHARVEDFNNHAPTEVEAVYIVGDFHVVRIDDGTFYIDNRSKYPAPYHGNISISGYPFYAGKIKFSSQFEYTGSSPAGKRLLLKVNDVHAAYIKLYLNGKPISTKYWAPYVFDITGHVQKGINRIEIIASTTLFNLMGPNRIANILDITFVGPSTFINFDRFTSKYELLPYGISNCVLEER